MKCCAKCHVEKDETEFWKSGDGLQPYCKPCGTDASRYYRAQNREKIREWERKYRSSPQAKRSKKNTAIKKRYGISIDEFEAILKDQTYGCAICQIGISGKDAHVDHCHSSGRVRGILCTNCNNGLGRFKDSVELLNYAIVYLMKEVNNGRG